MALEDFRERLVEAADGEKEVLRRTRDMWAFVHELFDQVVKPRLEILAKEFGGAVDGLESGRDGWKYYHWEDIFVLLKPGAGGAYWARVGDETAIKFAPEDIANQAFIEWLEERLITEAKKCPRCIGKDQ